MKVENVQVYGLAESIVASSYPMINEPMHEDLFDFSTEIVADYIIDKKTNKKIDRAIQLAQTPKGSGHDNFLNGIIVQFDLTFPQKAWTELQRYHFMDFVSSMSTMHRISKMNIRECMDKHVDEDIIVKLEQLQKLYNDDKSDENYLTLLYNIPSGFELTARMTTNYRQLKTIYQQRKNHRLPCWREFCQWIEEYLPLSKELICNDKRK